jgi:hypothetical protein
MLALAHHYNELVTSDAGVTYRARVYAGADIDGRLGGWIVFFPVGGGRVISTDRETTQSSMAHLRYWAAGLTHSYLRGALARALALEPEAQLVSELEQLERLESSAQMRAETLAASADAALVESKLVEAQRERTEERLLATVAETAHAEARAYQAAAEISRKQARTAEGELRARVGRGGSRKKK